MAAVSTDPFSGGGMAWAPNNLLAGFNAYQPNPSASLATPTTFNSATPVSDWANIGVLSDGFTGRINIAGLNIVNKQGEVKRFKVKAVSVLSTYKMQDESGNVDLTPLAFNTNYPPIRSKSTRAIQGFGLPAIGDYVPSRGVSLFLGGVRYAQNPSNPLNNALSTLPDAFLADRGDIQYQGLYTRGLIDGRYGEAYCYVAPSSAVLPTAFNLAAGLYPTSKDGRPGSVSSTTIPGYVLDNLLFSGEYYAHYIVDVEGVSSSQGDLASLFAVWTEQYQRIDVSLYPSAAPDFSVTSGGYGKGAFVPAEAPRIMYARLDEIYNPLNDPGVIRDIPAQVEARFLYDGGGITPNAILSQTVTMSPSAQPDWKTAIPF